MKRYTSRQLPGLLTEIQITPLLDLMLLLLLTVVVLVPAISGHGKMWQEGAKQPADQIELVVAPDLQLTLAGQSITQTDLIPRLRQRVADEPRLGVVVRVPAGLTAPALLQIMDALEDTAVRYTSVVGPAAAKTP